MLDLLLARVGSCNGIIAYEIATGELHVFHVSTSRGVDLIETRRGFGYFLEAA